MARRKGVTKSKNVNNRKHISDSSQPLKGNVRLKDDPGGTTATSRNKSPPRRNMDGPKLISDARNTSNTMIDHYNLQNHHQLSYAQSRDSPSLDGDSSLKKKGSNRISESVGDADETVTSATTTTTQRVATETPTNINNNNNSSSHNNNSSFSSTMTTTMTMSSSANDHKYLHKKFKRIASATAESNSAAIANVPDDSSSHSDQHRSQQQHRHQRQLLNDSNSNNRSSIISSRSNKVASRLEEIPHAKSANSGHSFKGHELGQVKERTNSLVGSEESSSGNSYTIVNGTGRLTPLYSAADSVSIADTGYGSDGEPKLSALSSNGLYKTAESVIATQPQLPPASHHLNNNVAHRMATSVPTTSRNSPSLAVQPPASVTLHTLRPDIPYNLAATKLPHPQQLAQMPSAHSPQHVQQHPPRQPVRNEQPSSQLQQQQPVAVDQNNSGRHSCPYCNLNCTKPSVLQKHIRTHTNERPYLCEKCCFAFKTKSNYYKHCRSRSHALRVRGIEPQPEDENSIGSDPDPDPDISNSSSDVISRTASPLDERTSSPAIQYQTAIISSAVSSASGLIQQQQNAKYSIDKPYKPKFHNASFYAKDELPVQKQQIQLLQLQQQQQLYQQSQQRQQQMQYQHIQQQHQAQLNSYHGSPNSHSMQSQSKVQHPEPEPSPVYFQQQQQLQQMQHPQSQQYHNQSSAKSRIEYLAQQRLQAAQSAAAQQVSASAIASSSFTESPSSSTNSSAIPTLGRSLSTGIGGHQLNVEEHISYLISRNEAIVNKELPLQKKYPKVAGKSKSSSTIMSNTTSRLAYTLNNKQQQQQQSPSQQHLQGPLMPQQSNLLTLSSGNLQGGVPIQLQKITVQQQQHQINLSQIAQMHQQQQPLQQQPVQVNEPTPSGSAQPLNLSKIGEQSELSRKRVPSESFASPVASEVVALTSSVKAMSHPQNPERSIIKNLLLYARGEVIPNGEGEQSISSCVLCKMEFHSADDLRTHAEHYCQGGPSSAPISPVGSTGYKYSRSNSLSVNLPEMNNPNSLAKLARSKLLLSQNPRSLAKLAWSQLKTKPSNLVLTQLSVNTNSTPQTSVSPASTNGPNMSQKLTETPLPSPGPLLGKTPLVESYNNSERKSDDVIITKVHEEARQFVKTSSPKRLKFDVYPQTSSTGTAEIAGPSHGHGRMYSMCGGDMTPLEKKDEPMKRFFSSGGCMIPLSECPDLENSPKIIRTPLLSGGSFQEISPKPAVPQTPKSMMPVKPLSSILTPGLPTSGLLNAASLTRFQFPPINSITAYNPLTLPPVSMSAVLPTSVSYGDKVIPFVPGIPGPNSLCSTHLTLQPPKAIERSEISRNVSPNRKKTPSPLVQSGMLYPPQKQPTIRVEDESERSGDFLPVLQRSPRSWVPPTEPLVKKSFNFTRIADNLSPRKTSTGERPARSPERGVDLPRHFNFDKIEKARSDSGSSNSSNNQMMPLHVDVSSSSLKEREQIAGLSSTGAGTESKFGSKSKFLRPTSLPLKPGTFTPKCHHGITPTANTLPLISPETPRPSKHCVQLYLNGHAYTYLGLKSSTKMFYCTVNCPQPTYIANMNRLSMYSKWQTCEENNPHPLRLGPKAVMSLYDSRQRDPSYSSAPIKSTVRTTHSQPIVSTPFENNTGDYYYHQMKSVPELSSSKSCSGSVKSQKSSTSVPSSRLVGGYESNEDYTYVRGRGRGRYVCSECGIRCKKPSMLKKHIRTHTDVRPYTCQHCSFSFKTKGNLTKHMQSKTHYKKCLELGINLGPMPESEFGDNDFDYDQQSINSGGGRTSSVPGESDSDEYSDGNDGETESSDTDESKSRLAEHEAARSLLSLSMTPPSNQAAISPNPFSQQHQQKLAYAYNRDLQQQSQPFPEGAFQCVSDRHSTDESLQMNRRVISFTSPKPPFDYQKQEQYFSNPSLSLKAPRNEDVGMKPMDLTKPRRMESQSQPSPASSSPPRISEVISEVSSESGLIKSLVSITNKIRPNMEHSFVEAAGSFNEDVQLQAYLTEQALKYTKIKQSQMNKTFNVPAISMQSPSMSSTIPTITITDSSYSVQSPRCSSNEGIMTSVTTTVTCAIVTSQSSPLTSITTTSVHSDDAPVESETVATSSTPPALFSESIEQRLENGEVENPSDDGLAEIPNSSTLKSQTTPNSTTTSAKSVASEYLKMTSAESRNIRVDESEDSCSDQELSSSEMGHKPSSTEFTGIVPPTVIVGGDGFKSTNEVQPMFRVHLSDDGRPVCKICSKTFQKQHQMVLHMNIHYMERKFKCEPCAVSFRTQGHLQKHERSEAHRNKVMMNSTFGVPTTSNPRPFECADCKVAFRIHGHLAKHLRSKTHVQKLECLQKLPFGTYAEIERAGISLTEIDTTDCDNSLASLRELAQRLIEKDPTKMGTYTKPSCIDGGTNESSSEDSPEAVPSEVSDASPGVVSSNSTSSTTSSALSSSSVDSPAGVKRKFDSFSSCSNDSISNVTNLPSGSTAVSTTAEAPSEKRIRTNSDP